MIDTSINQDALKFLPKPKAIIFDWDNTLVDTWPLIHQAINITLEKMGKKKFSLEQVQNEIHKFLEINGSKQGRSIALPIIPLISIK